MWNIVELRTSYYILSTMYDYKCTLINKQDVFCSWSCYINTMWDWLVKNEQPWYIEFLRGSVCVLLKCHVLCLKFSSNRFLQLKYFLFLQVNNKNQQLNLRHEIEVESVKQEKKVISWTELKKKQTTTHPTKKNPNKKHHHLPQRNPPKKTKQKPQSLPKIKNPIKGTVE